MSTHTIIGIFERHYERACGWGYLYIILQSLYPVLTCCDVLRGRSVHHNIMSLHWPLVLTGLFQTSQDILLSSSRQLHSVPSERINIKSLSQEFSGKSQIYTHDLKSYKPSCIYLITEIQD